MGALALSTAQFRSVASVVIVVVLLAGCAVGPNYYHPSALAADSMPAAFGEVGSTNTGGWKTAEPSAHLPRGNWWELYDEPELNRLEDLAATNNQRIAVALANLEQARAAVKVARADFLPQLNASPSATQSTHECECVTHECRNRDEHHVQRCRGCKLETGFVGTHPLPG
jgi:hypothetical protein